VKFKEVTITITVKKKYWESNLEEVTMIVKMEILGIQLGALISRNKLNLKLKEGS